MLLRNWRFGDAWRALGRLWDDPDDTAAVFEIIDALPGRAQERAFDRFRETPVGAQVLTQQRDLIDTLNDRDSLRDLPPDSLGRAYLEFMVTQELTPGGLVAASDAGRTREPVGPDRARFGGRLRDMHDLWHVVTGYDRDLRGETALLAFSFAQIRTPGVGFIVGMAYKDTDAEERRLIREGWRRGRAARWLPAEDWEALLPRPLDEVRESLRLGALPKYEPVYSAGAPAAVQGN